MLAERVRPAGEEEALSEADRDPLFEYELEYEFEFDPDEEVEVEVEVEIEFVAVTEFVFDTVMLLL